MVKNENIICISSIDWDFVWQGHQEIMSTFAKNGNRVLFIENTGVRSPNLKDIPRLKKRIISWFKSVRGFREQEKNLYIYSPMILPFPYSKIAKLINKYLLISPLKKWLKIMKFHEPIVWTFLPTGTALDIIKSLEDKKLLVYYCIADFYELADHPKKVTKTEDELIRKSDVIFAQGETLKERCRNFNDNIHIFPFGVKIETFRPARGVGAAPDDIKNIKKPIVGYIGGLHKHVDFELIKFAARSHSEWSIVLVGPAQADISTIEGLPNIHVLGKKEFSQLPSYVKEFDVGIIPYVHNAYTETVFPTKLNEYHAMGKPVAATDIPEVVRFNSNNENLLFIGRTKDEFVKCISNALLSKNDLLIQSRRVKSAEKNSWTTKIEEMSRLMENAIDVNSKKPMNWQENILKLYAASRGNIIRVAGIALIAYLLIFQTPLIWFLARPLKISQLPQKTDCIAVFAGGVGESGKAGEGYGERVEKAIELYKSGYAKNLIFSSGYMYAFKEPVVMRALAISQGVPQDAITLEDEAKNTYENVKLTADIMKKNGWKKAIVISSPYNMRRVSLVCKKVEPGIYFVYVPIDKSLFYGDEKRVQFKHIIAIMHEYAGIVYYWFKGYV